MKIVVDAMGGDHAPGVVIEGSLAAVKEYDVEVVLVGDQPKIEALLKKAKYTGNRISIHHTTETIEMCESAATSVRRKRNSSIVVGLNLVKEAKADAFFSAGNTGAVVCAATLELRLLPGIERAGIGIVTPTLKGNSLIIDVGANIDPKPSQLLQYGIMADAYCKNILNKPAQSTAPCLTRSLCPVSVLTPTPSCFGKRRETAKTTTRAKAAILNL